MLQPKLSLKVSQRQVLTPGLVQMVSVLALNKLELREMINTEMIENPVLEEIEETVTTLEERAGLEGDRERSAEAVATEGERVEKDPFDEIDFGSYFQDYLDPGFRTASNFEEYDKPSFENFLSQPSTLTDHLTWQLGSLTLTSSVRAAADLIVGNLNEDGYLTASDEELLELLLRPHTGTRAEPIPFERGTRNKPHRSSIDSGAEAIDSSDPQTAALDERSGFEGPSGEVSSPPMREAHSISAAVCGLRGEIKADPRAAALACLDAAHRVVHQLDPIGVGARNLRECLLLQIEARQRDSALMLKRRKRYAARQYEQDAEFVVGEDLNLAASAASSQELANELFGDQTATFEIATYIVTNCLALLQKKDMRELTRSCNRTAEQVQAAVEFIRTLDPRPGQRYNQSETRLIEPDVAFVKRDDQYVVLMNEDEMPALRLNQGYRRMLRQKQTEKDVREYVKERYRSAIQLLRNIEQRKNTIVRTCEVIVRRQADFLEHGESALRPMMIKEVAEEIGVHASTVSRAVANKYVHTAQGVYELRFFFSEGVNGPEGGDLPLVLLKRKVKKLIEDEDPRKPLTDDQLVLELQRQGIQVTRRTVAKYREDMQIPSTHQRRVR